MKQPKFNEKKDRETSKQVKEQVTELREMGFYPAKDKDQQY